MFEERELNTDDRLEIGRLLLRELSTRHTHALDLGAGHCRFSVICAELGMQVTAMDARTVRKPDDLPDEVSFIHGDFLQEPKPDGFDLVLMLGILYHLNLSQQQELLEKYRGYVTLVDTHCCPSEMTFEEGGYQGKPYREAVNNQDLMANPKASASTLNSFWHTEDSLKRFLSVYFSKVTKIRPDHDPLRTFYVCEP